MGISSALVAIMDMNFDGQPELLLGTHFINSSGFYVFTIDDIERFLQLDSVSASFSTVDLIAIGEEPLRFFQNDSTDRIIFSSLSFTFGGGVIRSIIYTDAVTLERYRRIECCGDGRSEHEHILWGFNDGLIERLPGLVITDAVFEDNGFLWDWQYWPCDIDLGLNSSDPSVVTLVNMVLEVFTELPAPQRFRFPGEIGMDGRFGIDDVQNVQDWIFEVAALWE